MGYTDNARMLPIHTAYAKERPDRQRANGPQRPAISSCSGSRGKESYSSSPESVGVAMPVDEALCELALCDLEDLYAATKLAPVGVRKQRKRSRPDA